MYQYFGPPLGRTPRVVEAHLQFAFEGYVFDPDRRELTRGSEAIAVGPQVFDVLAYLLKNRARVVSKDDLVHKGRTRNAGSCAQQGLPWQGESRRGLSLMEPSYPPRQLRLRHVGWFVLLWTASVAVLAIVAAIFRVLMTLAGMTV